MAKIKAGNIYMCLKDVKGYDSFTKGKVYQSLYDNALVNDNHIEVKVTDSECFRVATEREIVRADTELTKTKRATSEVTSEISEDMWEASKQYALRQVLASTDTKMSEQAYLSLKLFSGFEIAVAHKDGANWQKQQVIKKAAEWIKNKAENYIIETSLCSYFDYKKAVEDFKNAMEE